VPKEDRVSVDLPLQGVRVVDFGQFLAGPLLGRWLLDQGATVVKIDPPGGPRWADPTAALLDAGKEVVTLDLRDPSQAVRARALVAAADVAIENFRPGVLARLGLGWDDLRSMHPELVGVSLPGFASGDARRDLAGWETLVGAATGLFTDVNPVRTVIGAGPVYTALPLASVYAAMHAAIALTVALFDRERTGLGDRIEVPLADAAMSALGGVLFRVEGQPSRYDIGPHQPPIPPPDEDVHALLGAAPELLPPLFRPYHCADGRLLFVNAIDAGHQAAALTGTLGITGDLIAAGLRFGDPYAADRDGDNINNAATLSVENQRTLRELIADRLAARPAREWESLLTEAGTPAGMVRTTGEWLEEPALTASGVVAIDDEGTRRPGPIVTVRSVDPGPGAPDSAHPAVGTGPLGGVRVLDLTNVIAGPASTRTLAEYGADVVRIESPRPHIGPRMTLQFGIEVGQGKRSMIADLDTPGGRQILARLVERADVVVHNRLVDAAKRLGLTPEELRRFNPRLIISTISAYGGPEPGPFDRRPAFDPVLQAQSGIMARYGSPEVPQVHAIASCIDYLAGYSAVWGTALALLRRARTGHPSDVSASLVRAALAIQTPFAHSSAVDRVAGQQAVGPDDTDRIWKTADGWVAVVDPDHRAGAALAPTDGDIGPALAAMTTADALALLDTAGVPAHAVCNHHQIRAAHVVDTIDPDGPSIQLRRDPDHPCGHPVTVVRPTWVRADGFRLAELAPTPRPGRHTRELLTEIGLDPDDAIGTGAASEHWPNTTTYLPD
jgi:crotonobetainyl-CoA:carnitine CoA-transferase CaiB-like acyl-CoA transferase